MAKVHKGETIEERSTSARLKTQPWFLVVSQNESQLLALVHRQYQFTILLGIGTILGSVAIAMVIAKILTIPLTRLIVTAQQIAAGNLEAKAIVSSTDEIGSLASAFNSMTSRLRLTLQGLEQQVAERTQAIITSAEISRRISTILDQKQLVFSVVEEIQHSFNFYHAHIYFYDQSKENLVLVGGWGDAGQAMISRGHKIARGLGLVGRAAESNSIVLVSDTKNNPDWLANPLLPETKSEVAVPISIGDEVLGVLDVQHAEIDGLTQQTAELLQSIANQLAIAIQNSRLYSEAQRQADREALILEISQKIQSSTTIEGVLETAARELGLALDLRMASVQLDGNPIRGKNAQLD